MRCSAWLLALFGCGVREFVCGWLLFSHGGSGSPEAIVLMDLFFRTVSVSFDGISDGTFRMARITQLTIEILDIVVNE